ncbi:MAG: T9SS type A sorting domain-containing protein [Bacteroidota bacterium]
MKYLVVYFFIICNILIACGPSIEEKTAMEKCRQDEITIEEAIRANLKSTFDAPFPKKNFSLTKILGDNLQIYGSCYPLSFKVLSTRKSNLIINNETGDTLFMGTVCRYRGLYYFNEKINDTTFRIFALKITDSLIYGLQNYFQYSQIDSAIERGDFPKLIRYTDKNTIRLHPDKKELKMLFTSIIDNTKPFEIIRTNTISPTNTIENITTTIESDDFEILSKVYPNPAIDILNVDLRQKNVLTPYYLCDLNGKILSQGQFQEITNKIDVSGLSNGIYTLTIVTEEQQKETVKIIKSK